MASFLPEEVAPMPDEQDETELHDTSDEEAVLEGAIQQSERRGSNSEGRRDSRTAEQLRRFSRQERAGDGDEEYVGKHYRLFRALGRAPEERQFRDLEEIYDAVNDITQPFIARLEESVKRAICQRLTLEEFDANQTIFDYGDKGDKLYMIFSGRVQIEVPRTVEGGSDDSPSSKPLDLMKLANLESGKAFGELALVSPDETRNAKITAVKPTQLLVLLKKDYDWCVGFSQQNFILERVNFLRSVDRAMLDGVKEVDLQAMAGYLQEEKYTGAHVVLKQGEESDRIVFVKSGFCKVVRTLHPKYKESFDVYADHRKPPPNPFAPVEETNGPDDSHLQLGSRAALENLLRRHQALEARHASTPRGAQHHQHQPSQAPQTVMPHPPTSPSVLAIADGASVGSGTCTPAVRTVRVASADNEDIDTAETSLEVVVVDVLQQGRSFGIMEMMEGLTYQSSVVADPWCEVYVVTKYDIISNTSKTILHRLFCDYKPRLGDDRLMQRLKQKGRWNNFKCELLEEIRNRKRAAQSHTIDRREDSRRTGAGDMSFDDCRRVGKGEKLWDKRAQTPPRPTYTNPNGSQVQHIFRVRCVRNEAGVPDVVVEREVRDASMAALDEKILMTIANARFRDKFRRDKAKAERAGARGSDGKEKPSDTSTPRDPSTHAVMGAGPQGSLLRPRDAAGSSRSASWRSPRNFSPRSHQKAGAASDLHPVLQQQELEDKAKQAAASYLQERTSRIEAIRDTAKERIANPQSSRRFSRLKLQRRRSMEKSRSSRFFTEGELITYESEKAPSSPDAPQEEVRSTGSEVFRTGASEAGEPKRLTLPPV